MSVKGYLVSLSFFLASCATSTYISKSSIDHVIRQNTFIQNKLDSFPQYETQLIYIQIDRDQNNNPSFKKFSWNENPEYYFYPASMVKMPVALVATDKLNKIRKRGIDIDLFTPMFTDSTQPPQTPVYRDTTSWNGLPSIGHYIKKIFLVSDNDANNRLYEFIHQKDLNERLQELGYHRTHIIHRLDAPEFDYESNKYTNPVRFQHEDLKIYKQDEHYNPNDVRIPGLLSLQKGTGYMKGDELIKQPLDFSYKNYFSLDDMAMMIKSIMFPQDTSDRKPFDITADQMQYIRTCMSKLPRESKHPFYDSTHSDGYCKFFMYGDTKDKMDPNIRIFNKVGWAYGYLTDAAYIVDFKNKVEFILAATIYCNQDGILNDGRYDFESIGLPYLSKLGKTFYQLELKRKRKYKPDLSAFKLNYHE